MTGIQRNLLLGVGIAVVLAGALYWYWQRSTSQQKPIDTQLGGVSGTGDYTIEPVAPTPPELGPIYISDSYPKDAAAILREKIEAQYEILKKEPTRVDAWLQLGVNRKMGSDFKGAEEAWLYVTQAAPNEMRAVAYGDLGDLYLYFLKEYDKAETNFKQAIALSPKTIDYYRTLYYLYRDVYKDKGKEAAILEQGLKANPNNTDLLKLQAEMNASK